MLKVSNLHVNYGGINALRGIDISIEENQIVTLMSQWCRKILYFGGYYGIG